MNRLNKFRNVQTLYRKSSLSSKSIISKRGIEEFVDRTLFEGKTLENAGRSWKRIELRRKSFDDLHKLWIVLMKERNMLLTHERLSKTMGTELQHPERIKKVKQSMHNIKIVIEERHVEAQKLAQSEFKKRLKNKYYKWPVEKHPDAKGILEEIKLEEEEHKQQQEQIVQEMKMEKYNEMGKRYVREGLFDEDYKEGKKRGEDEEEESFETTKN